MVWQRRPAVKGTVAEIRPGAETPLGRASCSTGRRFRISAPPMASGGRDTASRAPSMASGRKGPKPVTGTFPGSARFLRGILPYSACQRNGGLSPPENPGTPRRWGRGCTSPATSHSPCNPPLCCNPSYCAPFAPLEAPFSALMIAHHLSDYSDTSGKAGRLRSRGRMRENPRGGSGRRA